MNRRTVMRSATGVAALAAFGIAEGTAMGLNAPSHFAPLTRDVIKANQTTYAT
ncbi:hypothetical protein ACFWP5_02645 [Streptomyces sp. NPDC058469]|uniref:hypothetical protein n=1 Tax=Streptomyces sp. NPDC058469 TaxID=3346514 RepID=UPI003647417F